MEPMNLHQLRYADPGKWQAAAEDLLAAAKDCEEAVAEIHANGTQRLEESCAVVQEEIGFSNQDGGTQNVRIIRPKETW